MNECNLYRNTAHLYDLDDRQLLHDDIKLYLNCVHKTKGNILELACGTGRVTLTILKEVSERQVVALDLSEKMLSVLNAKIAGEPSISNNLTVLRKDMKDFELGIKFGLILLIWRSFQLLRNDEDAVKCLQSVRRHMEPGSLFLLSVFLPSESYGEDWLGKVNLSYETTDNSNNRIRRSTKNVSSDCINQVIEYDIIYDIQSPQGDKEIVEEKMILKYYYPDQIKEMVTRYGFIVVDEYYTDTDLFLTLMAG